MDPTLLIAGLVGLLAFAKKAIDFLRLLTNLPGTRSGVITQAAAWLGGTAAVFLYGASQFSTTVVIDKLTLSDMDGPTKLLVGLIIGSLASVVTDVIQARDNSDSAKLPPLIPPPS